MGAGRMKRYGAITAAAALMLIVTACAEQRTGVLKVGVRDDIMNFGYFNEETGQYYGMEIDIANELADRLGYAETEFITVQPDSRKEMLLDGKVDCVIAAYSIADTRKENFDFTEPYYTDHTRIMVETSSMIRTPQHLKNKTIGIVNGANAGPLLAEKLFELSLITGNIVSNSETETVYEGARVLKAASYSELSAYLEEGIVDAACMDSCIAGTYMDEGRAFLEFSVAEQQYGVATLKDCALSKPIADAVREMLDDGTIAGFIDKWD